MTPIEKLRQQADALLCLVGIAALAYVSHVHNDWPATYIIGGIVALALRGTILFNLLAAHPAVAALLKAPPPPQDTGQPPSTDGGK